MRTDEIVDRLASLDILASVPRDELAWMAARGTVRTCPGGSILRRGGEAVDEMWVVLSGRVAFTLPKGSAERTVWESGRGYVLGAIPYSRMQTAPGTLVVRDEAMIFALHRNHFAELIRDCHALTAAFVHHMLDRVRDYHTVRLQDDRTEALGKLAAGLAHELNNPASAASRNAHELSALLDASAAASRALAGARLSDEQLAAIDSVSAACASTSRQHGPLEAADREDDISEWLDGRGVDALLAEPLATSDVSLDALERLAGTIPPESLGVAIRWVASDIAARKAAHHIEAAAARIHELVAAVKGFTFMDREAVPEELDIARGLADAVVMLESKARAKSVNVSVETANDLPRVYGFGSEINQVWAKLIDNAIDAAGTAGTAATVSITATLRDDAVVVRIADTGPGIADEIQARVFDPFFTTKPMGQGTGLGLDIARRLVHLHHGDIDFTSQPGRTVFRVRLPLTGRKG